MDQYVDVHGRPIDILIDSGKTWISLEDLKQTGFHLFKATEYRSMQVNEEKRLEFNLYMLSMAKEFFMKNKYLASEMDILKCIDACREALGTSNDDQPSTQHNSKPHINAQNHNFENNHKNNHNLNDVKQNYRPIFTTNSYNNSNSDQFYKRNFLKRDSGDQHTSNHGSNNNTNQNRSFNQNDQMRDDLSQKSDNSQRLPFRTFGKKSASPKSNATNKSFPKSPNSTGDDANNKIAQFWKNTVTRIFRVPEPVAVLQNNQLVQIVHVENGIFVLRTKECFMFFKHLQNCLESYESTPIKNVQRGELVIYQNQDNNLYRAIVVSIDGNKAVVDCLDRYQTLTVPVRSLMNITKELADIPKTFIITPPIKGYDEQKFDAKARAFVAQTIADKKSKFVVTLIDNQFDLKCQDDTFFSDKLWNSNQEKKESKVMLSNMKWLHAQLGIDQYQIYYRSPDDITLLSTSEECVSWASKVVLEECSDKTPYKPELNEMCLAIYEGEWYRCAISDIHDGRILATFVDYGNTEVVKVDDIRRFPEDLATIPILGIRCKLSGISDIDRKKDLIQDLIEDGGVFDIDIKEKINNIYEIEIPCLSKIIEEKS